MYLEKIFNSNFMPHGHCYLWTPEILWSHAVSDTLIGISYFSIPFALLYFVKKREDLAFPKIFILFGIFIITCGLGHFIDVWNLWNGSYGLSSVVRILTAISSVFTAIALWPLIPKALKIPSINDLNKSHAELEITVNKRTEELCKAKNIAETESEKLRAYHSVVVGRELEMINLKKEINSLYLRLNEKPKYELG